MRIYPAIDLIGGKTVRLEQGRYDKQLSYDISPIDAANKWVDVGAQYIHVIDLDGAKAGHPVNLEVVAEIARVVGDVPVQTGGGYREKEDIGKALDAGVSRVIIGSRAFSDPDFAKECVQKYGESIIFSVDAKSGQIMAEGWELESGFTDISRIERFVQDCGVREIIYTDIQKDGMLTGPNIVRLGEIFDSVNVNIISAGGVKTADDIRSLKTLEPRGLTGAIVGRALYEGTIDLGEAIDAGKTDNTLS